jgi:hypothetical protein
MQEPQNFAIDMAMPGSDHTEAMMIGIDPDYDEAIDRQKITPVMFGNILQDIRMQPNWRAQADKAADYYDDNQLDQETLALLESRGMGPLVVNMIKPTINVVLGMEAKTRSDWRVVADDDVWQEVAEAQSKKLNEAERSSRADRACSDAYAAQVKTGIGWVEVSRESDPFKSPYRARYVHRREIFWDWASKEPDLSDARYLVRERWYNVDQACAYFPEKAALIRASACGWSAEWLTRTKEDVSLAHAFDQEQRISIADWEWRQMESKKLAFYEVWYRIFVRGFVFDTDDGHVVELDLDNRMHQIGLVTGQIQPRPAVYSKLRMSLWIGPHMIFDEDFGTSKIPYIPFFGYREDLTHIPYGLIRSMISPQDEVNARRRKLLWMLSAKRVEIDSDALDPQYQEISDVASEVNRPDCMIVTNPKRLNKQGAVKVESDSGLSEQQYKVMVDSENSIQKTAGVFNAMMGRDSASTSGLAINSLVEQGTTALAEINDNYRFARRLVGQALLDLVIEDMTGKPMRVTVGEGSKKRLIELNVLENVDPATGLQIRRNDVSRARTKVDLEDVPSTPAYRAQMQTMLAEAMKGMPPNLQALLAPYWIEFSELPQRKQVADEIRKQLGLGGDGQDPQTGQLQQQLAEKDALIQQGMAELQKMQQAIADAERRLADQDRKLTLDETKEQNRSAEAGEKLAIERDKLTATTANAQENTEIKARQVASQERQASDNTALAIQDRMQDQQQQETEPEPA